MNGQSPNPRATVAVPLYRSAPFLPIIRANLDRLRDRDLEVLISDRHGLDDAIETLEREYGHDSRLRFLRATDEVGWVAHFNELMRAATGDYFVWMQHDDSFPDGYVDTLVAAARATPECLIAFGRIETRRLESDVGDAGVRLGRFCDAGRWGRFSAHRLLVSGWIGVPFRGAIDRRRALAAVGYMRDTPDSSGAEQMWIYALALRGPLVFTPATSCIKRRHAASFTGRLRITPAVLWAGTRVLPHYLGPLPPGRRFEARALFAVFTLARIAYHAGLRPLVPVRTAEKLRDLAYRLFNAGGPTAP